MIEHINRAILARRARRNQQRGDDPSLKMKMLSRSVCPPPKQMALKLNECALFVSPSRSSNEHDENATVQLLSAADSKNETIPICTSNTAKRADADTFEKTRNILNLQLSMLRRATSR